MHKGNHFNNTSVLLYLPIQDPDRWYACTCVLMCSSMRYEQWAKQLNTTEQQPMYFEGKVICKHLVQLIHCSFCIQLPLSVACITTAWSLMVSPSPMVCLPLHDLLYMFTPKYIYVAVNRKVTTASFFYLFRGFFQHYFYNSTTGRCEQFIYSGCEGNGNNFQTLEECQQGCSGYHYV